MVSKVECAMVHEKRWRKYSEVPIGKTRPYIYTTDEGIREAYLVECSDDNKITSIARVTQNEADIFENGVVDLKVYKEPDLELKKGDPPFVVEINLDTIGIKVPVRFFHQEGKEHPGEILLPQVGI